MESIGYKEVIDSISMIGLTMMDLWDYNSRLGC
jgi:hypothetical protein